MVTARIKQAFKALPRNWKVYIDDTITWSLVDPQNDLEHIVKWAKENNLGLEPVGYKLSYVENVGEVHVWNHFKVSEQAELTDWFFDEQPSTTYCQLCLRWGLRHVEVVRLNGTKYSYCILCSSKCDNHDQCGNWICPFERPKTVGNLCYTCSPVFKCAGCGTYKPKDEEVIKPIYRASGELYKETSLCKECSENECSECNKLFVQNVKLVEFDNQKLCPGCHEVKVQKEFARYEKFLLDELPKGGLVIPSLPARPIRTVSIETEVDGNKTKLCSSLYHSGIVRAPEVERYGSATPDNSRWAAFLKHDGSVSGGELISFMLELDKKAHADAFKDVLRKLRALDKAKYIEFNPNCGGHIHIDAHGWGTQNIWRLLVLWNYVEDFTYRLAGSGHDYGHRTLVPGHDRANGGRGYAHAVIKGPWGVRSAVGRAIQSQDRMCGLNFKPYLGAIPHCQCGAYNNDDMRSCKCKLPRCTIEWRVWNSQRNPRILHAWLAYMMAMHALADREGDPDPSFEKDYPALGWNRVPWDQCHKSHQKQVYDRIEWVFSNFVLTSNERDSLLYAIKKSEIPVSRDFEKQILSIKGASEQTPVIRAPKKNTYNSRGTAIIIKEPKPGDSPLSKRGSLLTRAQIR